MMATNGTTSWQGRRYAPLRAMFPSTPKAGPRRQAKKPHTAAIEKNSPQEKYIVCPVGSLRSADWKSPWLAFAE